MAHCFRFHYKQFFFWYIHTWLEPVNTVYTVHHAAVFNTTDSVLTRHPYWTKTRCISRPCSSPVPRSLRLCSGEKHTSVYFTSFKLNLVQLICGCPPITLCMSVIEFTSVFNSFSAWLRFIFLQYQLWKEMWFFLNTAAFIALASNMHSCVHSWQGTLPSTNLLT